MGVLSGRSTSGRSPGGPRAWSGGTSTSIADRQVERTLAGAAEAPRRRAGSGAEAYRLALLAEKLSQVLVSEMVPAA